MSTSASSSSPAALSPMRGSERSHLARMQQGLGLALWGSMVALSVWAWVMEANWAVWAALGVGVLHPMILALQLGLSLAVSRRRGAVFTADVWGPWRAWLGEWWVSWLCFVWWQPWCWRRWPDATAAAPGRRGVVFIHGYVCNRGLWQRWLAELHRRQHPFVAVNLEPVWGSIDEYPQRIEQAVQRVTELTGLPPLVVAHSMGGLAARAWWRAMPNARSRVAHIVTIGTPHHGTWLARWGHTTNALQMQEHSIWLQSLAQSEPADIGTHFTCWHSEADNIVFPLGTAVLTGCHDRHVPWVGHLALVDHPTVMQDTLALLEKTF